LVIWKLIQHMQTVASLYSLSGAPEIGGLYQEINWALNITEVEM